MVKTGCLPATYQGVTFPQKLFVSGNMHRDDAVEHQEIVLIVSSALDASQVCESLLNDKKRAEFIEDVKEQYEELREDHYASLASRKFLTLEKARQHSLNINWADVPIPTPKLLGTKARDGPAAPRP
eukprot:126515-Pleurochrysis_carterae.AAC.3